MFIDPRQRFEEKETVLTVQSQKADYYDPGGDCWETTPQISFSPETRELIRACMTNRVIGRREVECLRAPVILQWL
jgi:hypothetical protein